MKKSAYVIMVALLLAIGACGGGSGGNDGNDGGSGFNVTQFWCLNKDVRAIRLISWPDGTMVQDFDVHPWIPVSVAHTGNVVWVAASENHVGTLLKVDASTGEILNTVNVGYELGKILIAGTTLWVIDNGAGETATRPKIIKFDLGTEAVAKNLEISTVNVRYDDIIVADGFLYILTDNEFAVAKIDLQTDEQVYLTDIDETGGYGYGAFAIDGTTAWIVDNYHKKLLQFDLAAGAVVSRNPIEDVEYGSAIFAKGALYVSRLDIEDLGVIDLASDAITPIVTDLDPRNIYLNGNYIIVVGAEDGFGKVEDIDLSTAAVSHSATGLYLDACEMMN
jgi:hypothetical protein